MITILLKHYFQQPAWFDTKSQTITIDLSHPLTKKHRAKILPHELMHYNLHKNHKSIKLISQIPILNYIFYYTIEEPYVSWKTKLLIIN